MSSSDAAQYGAHAFVWQDQYGDRELVKILDSAERLGLAFVEVGIGDDLHFNASELGRAARTRNLQLVFSPGGAWPMECDVSLADPEHRRRGIEWHCRAIDRTAEAGGVAYAGAIYGHPGRVERRSPCADEKNRVAAALHELAGYAADRNVLLVLEPMSHFRTHIANTPGQTNEMIARSDHSNIFSLLDTYHLMTEVTDIAKAFDEMLPHLWALHACENNRGAPGTGMVPWRSLTAAIRRSGWHGFIEFETYNSTWRNGQFGYERAMFHNVCPDAEQFIRQSMAFLNDCFASFAVD